MGGFIGTQRESGARPGMGIVDSVRLSNLCQEIEQYQGLGKRLGTQFKSCNLN